MITITLTPGATAIIDDEDSPLTTFSWFLSSSGYACRSIDHIMMHRLVLHAPDGRIVDHIDGDRLNNRRSNLRMVTATENSRNRAAAQRNSNTGAKFSGVIWNAQKLQWQASIRVSGKLIHLGLFACVDEAKRARATAEIEHWGVQPRRRAALESVLGRTLGERAV